MSFQTSVEKLSPRVRDLILAFSQNGSRFVGESEKDKEEVNGWIEKTGQGGLIKEVGHHLKEKRCQMKLSFDRN